MYPALTRFVSRTRHAPLLPLLITALLVAPVPTPLNAADWPMLGRDNTRNPVTSEPRAPVEWNIQSGHNIKWRAPLGSITMADPVVANGLVWIGANDERPAESFPSSMPPPTLMCFRESDGQRLWKHVVLPATGIPPRTGFLTFSSSPLVEGTRLWLTTRYGLVQCFDLRPLLNGASPPRQVWTLDMVESLGISPHYAFMGGGKTTSIGASYRNRLYVITGNGIVGFQTQGDPYSTRVPAPHAPSLVCLDKRDGKVLWQDNSPGTNIFWGQWGSPLVARIGRRVQVITPQGDGWVRSFDALSGEQLWKLNINPLAVTNRFLKNQFLNAPTLYQNRILIAGGEDLEFGEAPGILYCIDPTRRGDVSLELEDRPGIGRPNPNSAVLWHFPSLGRAVNQVAVQDGLVIAAGFDGFVHCLDVNTGRQYWRHDTKAHVLASPLVVDGKIYVANEDGDVVVLRFAREKELLFTANFGSPIYSSPIFANGVLYLATMETLFAIQQGAKSPPPPTRSNP